MPGSSNFQVFNPPCTNQQSDATYTGDALRSGGITFDAILASLLLNKIFYQSSIGVAALMGMMANKGYAPNDGSASPATALTNLETVLANILTQADIASVVFGGWQVVIPAGSGSLAGYIQFPSYLNSLVIQMGQINVVPGAGTVVTLPIAFLTKNLLQFATCNSGFTSINAFVVSSSLTQFTLQITGGVAEQVSWLCVGH